MTKKYMDIQDNIHFITLGSNLCKNLSANWYHNLAKFSTFYVKKKKNKTDQKKNRADKDRDTSDL